MILVLSGKEVSEDLQIEFGKIPPVMLPVGNRPLLDHIIEKIEINNPNEKIALTLPHDYNIPNKYLEYLTKKDILIIPVNRDFSLGKSLLSALSILSAHVKDKDEGIFIHYGDTLLKNGIPDIKEIEDRNVIFASKANYNYSWLYLSEFFENQDSNIFCGLLYIKSINQLSTSLIQNDFDIFQVFDKYRTSLDIIFRDDWLDFGHVNTYYNSKKIVTTTRVFNRLFFDEFSVKKTSTHGNKLKAEALWFLSVPDALVHNTPRLISTEDNIDEYSYTIEYLFNPTLSELYVYGNHSTHTWSMILNRCLKFINYCQKIEPSTVVTSSFYDSLINKNFERLNSYLASEQSIGNHIKDEDGKTWTLSDILNTCHGMINITGKTTLIHGDFCFSNILFDFKKNDILVIDPRGIDFSNNFSVYGDIRYDLAKLLHSLIGNYDFIVSDNFKVEFRDGILKCSVGSPSNDLSHIIKDLFLKYGFEYKEILAITITLFLSMLPLHYDKPNRQKVFIYTAIKLFKELSA